MAYFGPYQIYKIEDPELVARVSDWDKLNVSVNNALGTVATDAEAGRDALAESITALGPGYAKLSTLPDGTDLNTFSIPGLHRISGTNIATILNIPDGLRTAVVLENLSSGFPGEVAWFMQRLEEYGEGARTWRRSSTSTTGAWGPWVLSSEQARNVTEWHVFLAAGQSNMVGRALLGQGAANKYVNPRIAQFGYTRRVLETATVPLDMNGPATGLSPATTFANNYLRTQPPHVGVLLVPAGRGDTAFTNSTSTYTWTPGVATNPAFGLPELAVQQAADAIAAARATGAIVDLKGIVWHQGEGNGGMETATYAAALDNLIGWFRAQLSAPNLPFMAGQLTPEGVAASSLGRDRIDLALQQTPARVAYTGFAPLVPGGAIPGDLTHMSQAGVDYIGRTYLDAFWRARNNTGEGRAYTDEQVATDRGRLTAIETKNTAQDGLLGDLGSWNTDLQNWQDAAPNVFAPLTRGALTNGTDLNTLIGTAHVGTYNLPTASTYPNEPAGRTGSAVLEVARGGSLAVLHRITHGNVMVWREALDSDAGTWSTWVQAETTVTAAKKCARLESGKWVWDLTGGTHYVIPDHTGALIVRPTPHPTPNVTPSLTW